MTFLARFGQPSADPVTEALTRLYVHLGATARALNDEVSDYPTPIARCDEQLTKLLEQRARAMRALRLAADAMASARHGDSRERSERIAQLLALPEGGDDDDIEHALRRRLADELAIAGPFTDFNRGTTHATHGYGQPALR